MGKPHEKSHICHIYIPILQLITGKVVKNGETHKKVSHLSHLYSYTSIYVNRLMSTVTGCYVLMFNASYRLSMSEELIRLRCFITTLPHITIIKVQNITGKVETNVTNGETHTPKGSSRKKSVTFVTLDPPSPKS